MSIDLNKLPPAPWFVNYTESVDEYGNGPAGLSIGPYEDDCADTFMHSDTFGAADGVPEEVEAAFEFVALARNALDVMMRRHWRPTYDVSGKWCVSNRQVIDALYTPEGEDHPKYPKRLFDDPFTALVEMDAWYAEHVESKQESKP